MADFWRLFPLSTVATVSGNLERTDGSVHSRPPKCATCPTHACLSSDPTVKYHLRECPFGFHYFWIDDARLALGFVAKDHGLPTQRSRKNLRRDPGARVAVRSLRRMMDAVRALPAGALDDFELTRSAAIQRMSSDPETRKDLARDMRREFAEIPLQQSHDFMQFVNQIKGHVEVLLREAAPDSDPYAAAESLPHLGAIFFAAQLMRAKIDSLAYLQEFNRVFGQESSFRVHPLVIKYLRIYRWQADAKRLTVQTLGESFGQSVYNADALGVVIHALLDNQVKYAPPGSKALVRFEESDDRIMVSFEGLGPKVSDDEKDRIFEQGYRGRAAKEAYAEGMGVGLASAGMICDALDLRLKFRQEVDESNDHPGLYWTRFSISLLRSA